MKKRWIIFPIVCCLLAAAAGLWLHFAGREDGNQTMQAVVMQTEPGRILVSPLPDAQADGLLEIPMQELPEGENPKAGDTLEIEFDGEIMEVYPGRFHRIRKVSISGRTALPTLTQAGEMDQAELESMLLGHTWQEIHAVWGEPAHTLSGFWADVYEVPDSFLCIFPYYGTDGTVERVRLDYRNEPQEQQSTRVARVQGKIYYDTGKTSDALRCGMMDGTIGTQCLPYAIPQTDDTCNFGTGYGYQYGTEDTIEILIDDAWCIFSTQPPARTEPNLATQ